VNLRISQLLGIGLMASGIAILPTAPAWAQASHPPGVPTPSQTLLTIEQPDAQRTKEELSQLLNRYPPTLRQTLAMDPALLGNQPYLAPYAGLVNFLAAHPEVARNPAFFVGEPRREEYQPESQSARIWRDVFSAIGVFTGFSMAIGLIVWLIRTFIDYRRWSRLAKVQTDVHTKLLDRFTANDDLIAYIQTPAGSKFLESSPIKLDSAPRAMGAPLGRILWSLQGGLVLIALGVGLQVVSGRTGDESAQPLNALGVIALALGIGFAISAIISYVISQRLGLIEKATLASRNDPPVA
jgi:hypothetical protein